MDNKQLINSHLNFIMTVLKKNRKLKILIGSVILLMINNTALFSQDIRFAHKPNCTSPLFVAIVEHNAYNNFIQKINDITQKTNASFYIINGSEVTMEMVKDSLNILLNSGISISKTNIYLVIVGNQKFFLKNNVLVDDLFPAKCYLKTDSGTIETPGFYQEQYQTSDLLNITNILKRKYLWGVEKESIQEKYAVDYNLLKAEHGLGLGMSMNSPISIRDNSYNPNSYTTYGLTGYRRLNEKWKLYGNLFFSIKRPDIKEIMQKEIQSQMDFSSISSGNDITVNINTEIEARFFINANIETRRFIYPSKKLKPFAGAGISYIMYTNMKMKIDTSLTGDPSSMKNGTGGLDKDSFNKDGMTDINQRQLGVLLTSGFEYNLNNKTRCYFKASYNLPFNTYNFNSSTINNLDFQVGFIYQLQRKRNRFYEYVRIK
jgi:hypothetical protein